VKKSDQTNPYEANRKLESNDQVKKLEANATLSEVDKSDNTQTNEYLRLRELILGEKQLKQLQQFDTNKTQFVAEVISEAIQERNQQDKTISTVLSASIRDVLQRSIKEKPQQIADTLFPIIGPAIRKSVAAALAEMVQSLNHLLENSLSIRSFIWRYQAWRSGSKYAEFVLLKTLKYRVEQVFFICRESGLLIQSVHAGDLKYEDPDLVSSMLSAINDFVKDSFSNQELSIDKLQFGDQSLHILIGPHAILAASAKGSVGDTVHTQLQDTLEKLHQNYATKLQSFDGDKNKWRLIIPDLEACLLSKTISKDKSKKPWLAILVILITVFYFVFLRYQAFQYDKEAAHIIQSIKQVNGYVITDWKLNQNVLSIDAFRFADTSPLASFVTKFEHEKSKLKLQIHEQNLKPLSQAQQLLFVKDLLGAITTVEVRWLNGQLYMTGTMGGKDLEQFQQSAFYQKYHASIDTSALVISSVDRLKEQQVKYQKALSELNNTVFHFDYGAVELGDDMLPLIRSTAKNIKTLQEIAPEIGKQVDQILLLGYADSKGAGKSNNILSLKRAASVENVLIHNGIPDSLLFVWGHGDIEGLPVSQSQQRRVNINVYESSIKPIKKTKLQ
jgi:outer membrane protein OmpA-like peptidoglycan-associated protein